MQITNIKIKNYRSIESFDVKFEKISVLCGPNSSGKSNILRAINLCFEDISQDKRVVGKFVRDNISKSKLSSSASIQIEITFSGASQALYSLAKESRNKNLIYKFKLTKSGNIIRTLGNTDLTLDGNFDKFTDRYSVVYIPTIRDLDNDGIKPFKDLFKKSILGSRGAGGMNDHLANIKKTLSKKASMLLGEQKSIAKGILNAKAIELSTATIELDSIYDNLELQLKEDSKNIILMQDIGTGHQSVVILSLYRQLGESLSGQTLYLFEEPDAHLHPPIIRAVGSQILSMTDHSQVIVSTHSPILIPQLGLEKVLHLKNAKTSGTVATPTNMGNISQSELNHKLLKYGLRITEALFTKLVVLVEGPSDAIVVGRLLERKTGRSSDQLDLIITPATGKNNIVEIAGILEMLNVSWVAIFDFDAACTTSSIPITGGSLSDDDLDEALDSLDLVIGDLNMSEKRGKKAYTQLSLVKRELEDGQPAFALYDDSTIQDIMENVIRTSSRSALNLRSAIRNNRVTVFREILKKHNIWLLRPSLEGTILGKDLKNVDVVDTVLRGAQKLTAPRNSPDYERQVTSSLHSLVGTPEILVSVVDEVYDIGGFNRSDLNLAVNQMLSLVEL